MQIRLINTQKVLSPTQITLADQVINPYRGCEFGCLYCYSQENKNIKRDDFFTSLGIKINAPQVLEKELNYKKPKRVLLGSTTECFQYQELQYKITKEILTTLNNHNIPYTILTKSHLISEYLPIISKNKNNKIYFTLNVASNTLVRLLEKKSPNLKQRIEAIEKIINSRVALRIHIGPFIPYLSSLKDIINILPQGVKEIDVELYHYKMGNFKKLLDQIEIGLNPDLKDEIATVYKSEENYQKFAESLKEEIKQIKNTNDKAYYYIVPDFNLFYDSKIDYHNQL
jgi:DNA repair photolyase